MVLKLTEKGLILRVREAYTKDVGRSRVRISESAFRALRASPGDVLVIKKRGKTVATAWHYPFQAEEDVIMMDGDLRRNVGASINEYVYVKKIPAKPAQQVVIAPIETKIRVDRDLEGFIQSRLIDRALISKNIITVNLFGSSILFLVKKTLPPGAVIVTPETRVLLLSEPVRRIGKVIGVTYEDIGGLAEEIQKIREMVELPLKHPELFRHLGIEPPKGVLLYGPPGCGKTLLARAVANEADANFYAINGPEITSKYYGESEAKLRNIFKKAEENAPSIIFIDEIDAIAPKREEVTGEAEKRVVSQLLTLMDGLNARGNVIVIAATNRIDAIDPALRRPGRFDREIELKVPDQRGRLEILQIHVRGMPLADDVDLEKLAEMTHGYTGADLAALCREAAMKALRRCLPMVDVEEEEIPKNILDQIAVCMDDFLKAYKEIVPTALREVEIQIPNVRWSDIGGLAEVKKKLKEAVEWPIKWPEKFRKWNITPVKGILLYGPPGTGKTLLAQALATECNLNFIAVRGSELLSKWVGESEKGVRRIFMRARLAAPSIIFFEEVEALAPKRGISVTDVMDRVISQLLTEIDGITRLSDVIVIAATNRPDLIDEALLRPGRIDLMLYTPPPNELERLEILKIHTRSFDMDEGVDLEEIARKTDYYTGADLASLCREAAMNALRRNPNANRIIMEDFLKALETIKPSLNEQIIKWYEEFQKTVRYSKFVKIPAIA